MLKKIFNHTHDRQNWILMGSKLSFSPHCFSWIFFLLLPTITHASLQAPTTNSNPVRPSVFYDAFSTRIYDPRGRILQLEYAEQATKKGGAAAGAISGDLAILASWTPRVSRRQAPASQQKASGIWKADKHVALAAAGMAIDAMVLAELARKECLSHKYICDSPLAISRLVTQLAQEVYETERHRIVPYAIDLLVCGYDESTNRPALYNIKPAGTYVSYHGYAVGHNAEAANQYLRQHLTTTLAVEGKGRSKHLKQLVEIVLQALMRTVSQEEQEQESQGQAGHPPLITEDLSLVVIGNHIPTTTLQVYWNPKIRRLNVTLPSSLVSLLDG